ncbi:MAG TPA: glycosyltransferase family 4 protein, partial [Egibacteraceae bacterium]|nr:glycosyltransferase family 4 protein [Egibacteraceae bacterium]
RTPWVAHTYLGHRNADPRYVIQRPLAVARAERDLRRTANQRPQRLLLHREASPVSRGGVEARLLRRAEFAVYDFDDALQWDDGAGSILRRSFPKAPKALLAVQLADRVIAGNATLADWASDHSDDVVIIPSCVSVEDYAEKRDYAVSDPPRLGWIGTPSEEKQLLSIAEALSTVHRRTGARLTIMGGTDRRLGRLERMVDRLPWSERAQGGFLRTLDIGLMPLVDEPYERGKCGYKLLQYAAAGLPAVASPVGVSSDILALTGMPAPDSERDWESCLAELLSVSAEERAWVGSRARTIAQMHYSYDAWLLRWERAVGVRAPMPTRG